MRTKSDNIAFDRKKKMLAERLADPEFTGTIGELCKEVGIARSTFYKWTDDPAYRRYLQELIDKYTDSELAAMWKALISKGISGDVAAMKLYFELKGKYKQQVQMDGVVIFTGEDNIAE